jgi:hypothetical protein
VNRLNTSFMAPVAAANPEVSYSACLAMPALRQRQTTGLPSTTDGRRGGRYREGREKTRGGFVRCAHADDSALMDLLKECGFKIWHWTEQGSTDLHPRA